MSPAFSYIYYLHLGNANQYLKINKVLFVFNFPIYIQAATENIDAYNHFSYRRFIYIYIYWGIYISRLL